MAGEKVTIAIPAGRTSFSFLLQRKRECFGRFKFDQWWMPIPSVYPTGTRAGENYWPIIDCWWTGCQQHGWDGESENRELYLLAQLLPLVRSKGSPRIVADAVLSDPEYRESARQLEQMLLQNEGSQCSEQGFRDSIVNALGPRTYSDEDRTRYSELLEELLHVGRRNLAVGATDAAFEAVQACWAEWDRKYGRRSGHKEWKTMLDIFSYECRAALHQCYSAVWCWLMPILVQQYGLSAEGLMFHEVWHCQQRRDSDGNGVDDFHLFAGHVFGLHPAGSVFIQTKTGRKLIGDYLENPDADTTWQRLLAGLQVTVFHYAGRRDTIAKGRSVQPLRVGEETQWVEELQEERKRGNLRREPPGGAGSKRRRAR